MPRHDARSLTFVIDRLFTLPRTAQFMWIGDTSTLRSQVDEALARLGFVHRLSGPDDLSALAAADVVLIDNLPSHAESDDVLRFDQQIGALVKAEAERLKQGGEPRQVIAINAVHSRLETFLIAWFDVVLCPFTTRLRPALLRHCLLYTSDAADE